jgi:hypothetical protein
MQFQMNEAWEVLSSTPEVVRALLAGKSDVWVHCRKTADSFSPLDVVAHLRHAERADWIPRVRILLEQGDRKAFDPFDRFAFQDLLEGQSVEEILDGFATMRRASLDALRELVVDRSQLKLTGVHPEFGRVTLENLLATWVVHDLGHIAQIVRGMAHEYHDAVGPWRAYTRILD